MQNFVVLGAGGFARQVLWAIDRMADASVVAMLDELIPEPKALNGIDVFPDMDQIVARHPPETVTLIAAVGSRSLRRRWAQSFADSFRFGQVVDPSVLVAPSCVLGAGVTIMPGSICSVDTSIGDYALVGMNCSISHDSRVGAFSHLAGGVTVNGRVEIGAGCRIGAGATILPGVRIGDGAKIGAGAAVVKNIPAKATAVGVPARIISTTGSKRGADRPEGSTAKR